MDTPEGDQLRDVLSKRHPILDSLYRDPKTKPELIDELEYSRSTINRAVDELLDVECVEPTETAGRRFRLTHSGTVAFQLYRAYRTDTDLLRANAEVLNTIPSDDPLNGAFLSDAEIHSSVRTPDVAHEPGIELLETATSLTGTAPVVHREYFEILTTKLRTENFEMELVVESELLDAIAANYGDEFAALTEFDSVDVYATDVSLPYALWLFEHGDADTAGITIYEDGGVKGTVVNDAESAVSWANEQYARYRESASRVA